MKKKQQKKDDTLANLIAEEEVLQESSRLSPEEFASRAEALINNSLDQSERARPGRLFNSLSPLYQRIALDEVEDNPLITLEEAAETILAFL